MNSLLKRWFFAFLSVVFISCSLQALLIKEDFKRILARKMVDSVAVDCFIGVIWQDIERQVFAKKIFTNARRSRVSFNFADVLSLVRWTLATLNQKPYLKSIEYKRLEQRFDRGIKYTTESSLDKIFEVILDVLAFRFRNIVFLVERCRICKEQLNWYCTSDIRNSDYMRDDIHNECRRRR